VAEAVLAMTTQENRLDPSQLDPAELDVLMSLIGREERPALVGREGVRIDLPEPIFHVLVNLIRQMREGRAVVLMPEDETFTTQAAASFLGVSRQHLVDLMDKGEIPHHRVGTHRRVTLKDLLVYQKVRDTKRRQALGGLFKKLKQEGYYETDYTGDAG
jgi:excisionase family DNA binding protein